MPDTTTINEKGHLYQLSLAALLADPNQPRKVIEAEALDELAASVGNYSEIALVENLLRQDLTAQSESVCRRLSGCASGKPFGRRNRGMKLIDDKSLISRGNG